MNDKIITPAIYNKILKESDDIGFSMPSDLYTGCLLRTLVRSKPAGNFLEIGTGTGLALSWIIESMDEKSNVISFDNDEKYITIARKFLDSDPRVEILCEDGDHWIIENQHKKFDLIFADSWPGKYRLLDETLSMLEIGGFYIIDDMLPQPNWLDDHSEKVQKLIARLDSRKDLFLTKMNWSTGIIISTKIA